MSNAFLQIDEIRSVADRGRRIAFWAAIVAWVQTCITYSLYASAHELTLLHYVRLTFYTLTFGSLAWSSFRNWHFKTVFNWGMAAIYTHMWGVAFFDAFSGSTSVMTFPALLFTPIFLVLISGYRMLLGYAFIQAILVFVYARTYVAEIYGFDENLVNSTELAGIFSLLSFVALIVLTIVSYSRTKTDQRLLSLVQETERLAAEDPLTGLSNRRSFMNQVDKLWNDKIPFVVVFIDLDRFKPLNDEYGHAIGDRVLQVIGQRLKNAPGILSAARFGGDEFAVVVKDLDQDSALHEAIAALHSTIKAEIDIDVSLISVGASLGYARAVHDGFSVSDLLHAADTAMMRCKASGGGVAKFDPDQDDAGLSASAISESFRKALTNGQIKPALQPVVDAKTQKVIGHELLARWTDSGLSRDPTPLDFIPIAEKLGLLNELLWSTMRIAMPYLRDGTGFLSINVSPSQLSSRSFINGLVSTTEAFGFALNRIEIEVTESVAFRNIDSNVRTLNKARELGCRIVLDDFGSGYSSLSLLGELPLDKVKLDKSLQNTRFHRGVLEATIRLANDLGFECCVEGIETENAAQVAAQLGCSQMQGFWFGYPEVIERKIHRLRAVS